jgi:hypothetical protein
MEAKYRNRRFFSPNSLSTVWRVPGVVRHTQYNTPVESMCAGTAKTAWIFNDACSFTQTTLDSQFFSQVKTKSSSRAHFSEVIETDFRVYDASLGAQGNRPGQTDISGETRLVGTVVYPLPSSAQKAGSIASNTSIGLWLAGTFFWWPQSNQYIFQIDKGKALNLVLVKLKKNGRGWEVFLYDLNKDGLVCETTCEASRVTSLALVGNDAVDVRVFPGQLGAKDLSFRIPLDRFKQINNRKIGENCRESISE